jgi:DNA-binding transcriptional LysR family regulator
MGRDEGGPIRLPDLDLRMLRYFVAVAEASSFTEAAAKLYISQPALSQAVQRLERELGTRLIERGTKGSRRGIGLSKAGEVFLPAARDLLVRAERAVTSTREAVGRTRLRVGFGTSTPRRLTRATLEAAERIGHIDLSLDYVPWGSELTSLIDGHVDLMFLLAPPNFSHPQLDSLPLRTVRRMAVFHATHPLASRPEVSMHHLAGEPIIDAAYDRDYWLVDPRPDNSRPTTVGPAARTVDEMLAFVSAGRGMAITSSSVAETSGSEELAFVPIADLQAVVVYLVTRTSDRRSEVALIREQATLLMRQDMDGEAFSSEHGGLAFGSVVKAGSGHRASGRTAPDGDARFRAPPSGGVAVWVSARR